MSYFKYHKFFCNINKVNNLVKNSKIVSGKSRKVRYQVSRYFLLRLISTQYQNCFLDINIFFSKIHKSVLVGVV